MTERVILESEVFMTDTKKNTLTILAVVLTIAVIFSACTSIFTAKAVYDLRAEAKALYNRCLPHNDVCDVR